MSYIDDVISLFTTVYKLLLTFPIIGISAIAGVLIYRFLLLKYPTLLQSLVTKAESEISTLEGKTTTAATTAADAATTTTTTK